MALKRKVLLQCKDGLHARPAMQFVQLSQSFKSSVTLTSKDRLVDGKSILELLTLAADHGTELLIEVTGEDEEETMNALASFLQGDGA